MSWSAEARKERKTTRVNRDRRGRGVHLWSTEARRLDKARQAELRQRRGRKVLWSEVDRRLSRNKRREENAIRRARPLLHRILGVR